MKPETQYKLERFMELFSAICIAGLFIGLAVMCAGCGHSMTRTDRGDGGLFRVPLPDGSSLVEIMWGEIDSTTTLLRGGATYDSSYAAEQSDLFDKERTEHIRVSTIPAINEKNVKEVLMCPDTDPKTKQMLIMYMTLQQAPEVPISTISTGNASAQTDSIEQPSKDLKQYKDYKKLLSRNYFICYGGFLIILILIIMLIYRRKKRKE